MPCYEPPWEPSTETAALCAIMRVLIDQALIGQVLASVDWTKAGITADDLYQWWEKHKVTDATEKKWS